MRNKRTIWVFSLLLIVALASCNSSAAQQTENPSAIQTMVALNVAQTQLASTMTSIAQNGASTTNVIVATPTVTLTPLAQVTPTLQGVWLTLNQNTNCRVGPASYYPLALSMNAGQQVEAVGRSTYDGYYYVSDSSVTGGFCWLWDRYATVTGDVADLPVYTPQPTATFTVTPTPVADIMVSYVSVTSCGSDYTLRLSLTNNSSTTWQSVDVFIIDNTTSTNFTHISNTFRGYNGCTVDSEQADLTKGENGIVSNYNPGQFTYDPTGHNLTVTVTVYSEDGLAGTSVTKKINITP